MHTLDSTALGTLQPLAHWHRLLPRNSLGAIGRTANKAKATHEEAQCKGDASFDRPALGSMEDETRVWRSLWINVT